MKQDELEDFIKIAKLHKCTIIDLPQKLITKLLESIGELSNLISLNLRDNDITSLPDNIGNLSNLIGLDLSLGDRHCIYRLLPLAAKSRRMALFKASLWLAWTSDSELIAVNGCSGLTHSRRGFP